MLCVSYVGLSPTETQALGQLVLLESQASRHRMEIVRGIEYTAPIANSCWRRASPERALLCGGQGFKRVRSVCESNSEVTVEGIYCRAGCESLRLAAGGRACPIESAWV
jgi:hypothetical protein